MADYSTQVIHAATKPSQRTISEINLKKAAVLHDVFQRIGALDIYFGLEKDVNRKQFPLNQKNRRIGPSPSVEADLHIDENQSLLSAGCASEYKKGGTSNNSLEPRFTIDEWYKANLKDRQYEDATVVEQTGDDMPSSQLSNEKSKSQDETNPDETNDGAAFGDINAAGSKRNGVTSGDVISGSCDENLLAKQSGMQRTNTVHVGSSGHRHEHRVFPSKFDGKGNDLSRSDSLDLSELHKSNTSKACPSDADSRPLSGFKESESRSDPANSLSYAGETTRRLRIAVWLERWFIPNLSEALSCVSKMAADVGEGLQSYFTPLKLGPPNKKFDEVYLSSLEYAILKDDLTRCYFYIEDDHKEHLMMREVDDYRRLYQRRRINFQDFCHHFHPFLSRKKEDYARNKEAESHEIEYQRRAIQQILEKNIYGLSIERPNEFFKKNCGLKPFQMIEPIPQK
ncbi:hypothetical protein X943_000702 [Babesia divergens]|uniref:Uncharacterized protein n=1 Tax=Babesia divergens TaxID=32595 RepID=A0AAD9LHN9_BABDI|nr:hypothetical protein X943_000702 [Babesia divergens]